MFDAILYSHNTSDDFFRFAGDVRIERGLFCWRSQHIATKLTETKFATELELLVPQSVRLCMRSDWSIGLMQECRNYMHPVPPKMKSEINQLKNEKKSGCLRYIGDYTTQLYGDYNKPL